MVFDHNILISNDLSSHAAKVLGTDLNETFTYFIENQEGTILISQFLYASSISSWYETNDPIEINSIGHSSDDVQQIRNLFNKLDPIIDIDFEEMSNNNGSMIDFYSIDYSSKFENNQTVGQLITQENNSGCWFDLFWKDTNNKIKTSSLDFNTIVHELGHALGLSHPNNDPTNKQWSSDQTVMSYNRGIDDWSIWFTNNDLNALKSIWGRENDDGNINLEKESHTYKYKKTSTGQYFISTHTGDEEITQIQTLSFPDKSIQVEKDIISIFDQLNDVDDITGKVFRLYNSALNRFPDISGFEYWVSTNRSDQITYKDICNSFLHSEEYREKNNHISDTEFIKNLYSNVLSREADSEGFNYWITQLSDGVESKNEILMGFSESTENKSIFLDSIGL